MGLAPLMEPGLRSHALKPSLSLAWSLPQGLIIFVKPRAYRKESLLGGRYVSLERIEIYRI